MCKDQCAESHERWKPPPSTHTHTHAFRADELLRERFLALVCVYLSVLSCKMGAFYKLRDDSERRGISCT